MQSNSCKTKTKNLNVVIKSSKNEEVHKKHQNMLYVEKLSTGKFQCKICECSLSNHDRILSHVEREQHAVLAALNQQNNFILSESTICSEESKQTLLSHKTLSKCNTIFCAMGKRKMNSMHNYIQHITGKSHINHVTNKQGINSKDYADENNIENSKKNINTSLKSMTMNLKNYININNNEEWATSELSDHGINRNNLFAHINRDTHKYFHNYAKNDMILYECICCKLIIQEDSLIVQHLTQKNHLLNLQNALKHIKVGNIKESTNATDGIKNTVKKYLPLLNVLLLKEGTASLTFRQKCFLCLDSLNIAFLSNIRTNIDYQCSICSVKISGNKNLIQHYKGKIHLSKMGLLLSYQEDKDNVDTKISALTDSLNKISITDNKSQSSNVCAKDLIVPKDVYKQLMKDIISPCIITKTNNEAKHTRTTLTERFNKSYCSEYFELENKMYTITQEKINNIQFYFKFLVQDKTYNLFCVACKTKVAKESYLLYEHTCLLAHKANIAMIQSDDKEKDLIKEYMRVIAEKTVKCYVCNINMLNKSNNISTHIKSDAHKLNHKNCRAFIDITIDSILEDFSNLYYSIQRFCCVMCEKNTMYKVEFLEHIVKNHKDSKKYTFDYCIPCATLWLSTSNSYEGHCSDIMHKYLLKSKDFMVEDLPKCIKKLLTQVDETVKILFQEANLLIQDDAQEKVRQSLESIAKTFFPKARAFLFGSRLIGISFRNSDIDIYIDCEYTYYGNNDKVLKELKHLEKAVCTKDDWEIKETLVDCRVPIMKLIYKPRDLDCDVSFKNGLSVEKSKLLRLYYNACSPCKKLTLFIKKWFSFFNLPEGHGLVNYALYWLIIFYLQIQLHLPSVAELIKQKNKSQFVDDWQIGYASPKCNDNHTQSTTVLLLGFFEYYANFDYQTYIVCPLMGSLIAKKHFSLHLLPPEMQPYIHHINTSSKCEFLRIDTPLCVQDPLELSQNLTKGVVSITLKYFKQYCQDSAAILKSRM